jgi:WD40 repeat protein
MIHRFVAHPQDASARFSPDGLVLLTWSDERDGMTIRLWTTEGEQLDGFRGPSLHRLWFSQDGQWIMGLADEPRRTIGWSLDLAHLVQAGCTRLAAYLSNPSAKIDKSLCK